MDIKEKINAIVEKVKNDPSFKEEFKANPVKAVEGVLGVDLPDEQVQAVVEGVKAKTSIDDVKGKLGGLFK